MRTPDFFLLALLCHAACVDAGAGETGGGASTSTGDASGTQGTDGTGTTGTTPTTGTQSTDSTGAAPTTGEPGDTGWIPARCYDAWDDLQATYPDAGPLQDCAEVPGGYAVVRSLLVVDGITIDNNGAQMQPCVEARCDADYAYIASNDLPHYDYVQTTPNALVEADTVYRVALAPARPGADLSADPTSVQSSCADAYDQYLSAPNQATATEPSSLCATGQALQYLRETLESGETATYTKILCLGSTGVGINGVSVNGPNEAGMPDPFGNPLFNMPQVAGEPDIGQGFMLDLCGGHSGGTMHYHGFNEACFAQAPDGKPANSYAAASQAWDLPNMLGGACDQPSAVVGWNLDGYPIKGPCVCTARDGDTCTEVKRVRSAWVYDGLGGWGDDPDEAAALDVEGTTCAADSACCPGGVAGCDFRCAPVLRDDDGPDGSVIESRCALLDYAWCTHRFVDRSLHAGGDFVYLDRCNGYEGPDGYAYHATASFPYVSACYRGVPNLAPAMMMGGGEGGMNPPKCEPGQMMCCGDDFCGGPETAMNCPEDCG